MLPQTVGVLFIVLLMFVIPNSSLAVTNLTVQIQGATTTSPAECPPSDPNVEVIVSGCGGAARDYGNFKIAGKDGTNPASVKAVEGAADSLKLMNAKITADVAASPNCNANDDTKYQNCPDVFFWVTFDQPPSGQAADITFYRESFGEMKRGANPATGSSFRINGWVNDLDLGSGDNPVGNEQKKYICATPPATCMSVNLGQTEVWLPVSLTGQRELKVRFWFTLKYANDALALSSAHLANTAGGGEGMKVGKGAVSIANDPEEVVHHK